VSYSIRHELYGGGRLIAVGGDADVRAAEELQIALSTAAETTMTIDLSEAALIDSRTIAVLVDATERLRAGGGDLLVVCRDPNILRLFQRIGLDSELTIVESREQAETRAA
jgi:anti-sigma B factor antagonist